MASYDVEEILDSRKKGKITEYLVRWAPTWETEKNLNCNQLIKDYKAKKGDVDEVNGNADNEEEEEETNQKSKSTRKAAKSGDRKRKATQKATTPKRGTPKRRR